MEITHNKLLETIGALFVEVQVLREENEGLRKLVFKQEKQAAEPVE